MELSHGVVKREIDFVHSGNLTKATLTTSRGCCQQEIEELVFE
jgi:hypothetical protein